MTTELRPAETAVWRRARAVCVTFVMVVVGVIVPAAPALAHAAGGGTSFVSNFHSSIEDVSPRSPGVEVRLADGGQYMVVTNHSATPLVVYGYHGEPFLRISQNGVWRNVRSRTVYPHRREVAGGRPPERVSPRTSPEWKRVSGGDTARWHDQRIHWTAPELPPSVRAAPNSPRTIADWTVRGRYGGESLAIAGTLVWVPGPSPVPWLALAAVVATVVAALGWFATRRWPHYVLAALGTLLACDLARSVLELAGRSGGLWVRLDAFVVKGLFAVALWAGAIACLTMVRRRRVGAAAGAAFVGVSLAVVQALPDLAVLWHSQVAAAGSAWLDRMLLVLVAGVGLGLAGGAARVVRRVEPPRSVPEASTSSRSSLAGSD